MTTMKKNIRSILHIVMIVTLVSSCSDFLDKEPLTNFSSENFWKTEQDVQAALAATYSTHRTSVFGATRGSNGVSFAIEALSDNAISTSGYAGYNNILQGGINPGTGGAINQFWSDSYNGIAKCNYFLDNIDRAAAFLTEENYNKYKSEALFNRCYFYNELVQLYGDVPLILVSQDAGSGYASVPRTPKAEVVTQLLSDIDVAIAGLPNVAYTDGHAVKGSAIMLKVRILMNNALANTAFYSQAAETAWSLIGDPANPFALSGNYPGIFFNDQKGNKEIMFSAIYQAPDDYHQLDQYVGSRMSFFPTPGLRDAYETNPLTGLKDPRLGMTIIQVGDPWVMHPSGKFVKSGTAGTQSEGGIPFTDMAFKKWINPTIVRADASTLSDQDIIKMRYADLLLLYAEAMFESGQGGDQRALDALNAVRTRPGVNMPPVVALTQPIIRNERRVELAFEGHRYNDLIRWRIAETEIPKVKYDKNGKLRKFDGYLWPIPQQQMDIMRDVWQNNAPW
jgi:hypothetical protein